MTLNREQGSRTLVAKSCGLPMDAAVFYSTAGEIFKSSAPTFYAYCKNSIYTLKQSSFPLKRAENKVIISVPERGTVDDL